MSGQYWVETHTTAQTAGSALSNSVAATSLLPTQAKFTLPANFFAVPGKQIRVQAQGRLSNIVTTPGTFTFDLRFGGTVVWNGGAAQLSTTAHTNLPWWLDITLTLRAVGATANLMGQGKVHGQPFSLTAVADSTTTVATLLLPNTAPVVGNNFDAGVSQVVDLFGTFSVANAGNAITLEQYALESVN